jgi:hypothetical protein
MRIHIIFYFIIACNSAIGQIKVTGHVIDNNGNLIYARIYLNSQESGKYFSWYPEDTGYFEATTSSDFLTIVFILEGYKMKKINVYESKYMEVKLTETFKSITGYAVADRSIKSVLKIENEVGTTDIYSIDTIAINNSLWQKKVRWEIEGYKVYLPFDSLVNFLQAVPYRQRDISFGLNYLKMNSKKSTILISKSFVKQVGRDVLNDFAIEMIKENSITIEDNHGKNVEQLILKDILWNGYPYCMGCCWGGLQFSIGKTNLFHQGIVVC